MEKERRDFIIVWKSKFTVVYSEKIRGSKIEGNNFVCSRSWINRFRKRNCITGKKNVGKSASVECGNNTVITFLTPTRPGCFTD